MFGRSSGSGAGGGAGASSSSRRLGRTKSSRTGTSTRNGLSRTASRTSTRPTTSAAASSSRRLAASTTTPASSSTRRMPRTSSKLGSTTGSSSSGNGSRRPLVNTSRSSSRLTTAGSSRRGTPSRPGSKRATTRPYTPGAGRAATPQSAKHATRSLASRGRSKYAVDVLVREASDPRKGAGGHRNGSSSGSSSGKGKGDPEKKRIQFTVSELKLLTTLGTGTFGRVRLVQHPNGNYYALKILKKSEVIRLKQVDHIKNEVRILGMIQHPYIVQMLGHTQSETHLYMLLQYIPGGELFSHLRRENKFSNDMSRFYAAEIVLAFQYLHSFNIVYRDLKPENLLITGKGHVMLTDFGFAKVVTDRTWTLCGTPEYLAPEIIQSKGHNKSVDWWAIGILIYEMLAGFPPFFDETPFGIYQRILAGHIKFPSHMDVKAKDLIRRLLTADRTRRLGCLRNGAEDIKGHRWFGHMDWEGVYKGTLRTPFKPDVRSAGDTRNFDKYPSSKVNKLKPLSAAQRELFEEFDRL